MSGLFTFDDFVAAMKGRPIGPWPAMIGGIAIDSRTAAPGDAFFAIRGDRFDGHDFVGRALVGGAVTAVIAEAKLAGLGRVTASMVVVEDVLGALADLGMAARARAAARIAAVTGSAGKTTTKEMLLHMLRRQGGAHGSPASFNNHWGVPLTLARMPPDVRFGVFEIGMNHPGEIQPLVAMVRPHVAIITNVEPVHLAFFDGVEAIAAAKAEIFLGLEPSGTAVLNRDNPHYALLKELAREAGVERVIGFGEHPEAAARLEDVVLGSESSMAAARILGVEVTYTLGMPGRHIVQNSLAALAAVAALGGDVLFAADTLADFQPPKGRGERHKLSIGGGTALLIDESYNANPASMRAAIALVGQLEPGSGGRRIAVLGDMLELGPSELDLHADLAAALVGAGIDRVYLAGPRMAALWEALPEDRRGAYCDVASGLVPVLVEDAVAGDVIMVKGSNGSRMGPVVEALKAIFGPDGGVELVGAPPASGSALGSV